MFYKWIIVVNFKYARIYLLLEILLLNRIMNPTKSNENSNLDSFKKDQ